MANRGTRDSGFAVADALSAGDGGVEWIGDGDIAERLRILRRDPAAWHLARTGQFSLAGAQAKTALYYDTTTRRWGDPWGAIPTTHILKPAVIGFDDHDLNEHLCLEAAHRLGIRAARSRLASFDGERVIVVERYDRTRRRDGSVFRVHQEDMCQAMGLPPTAKYQNEGGPTPEQIIGLLRRSVFPANAADEDISRFVSALAFNWIFGGTGAIGRVNGRHWRRFADTNMLDPDETIALIDDLAARTPASLAEAVQAPEIAALGVELPDRLLDRVAARANRCRAALEQT